MVETVNTTIALSYTLVVFLLGLSINVKRKIRIIAWVACLALLICVNISVRMGWIGQWNA